MIVKTCARPEEGQGDNIVHVMSLSYSRPCYKHGGTKNKQQCIYIIMTWDGKVAWQDPTWWNSNSRHLESNLGILSYTVSRLMGVIVSATYESNVSTVTNKEVDRQTLAKTLLLATKTITSALMSNGTKRRKISLNLNFCCAAVFLCCPECLNCQANALRNLGTSKGIQPVFVPSVPRYCKFNTSA